MKPYTKYATLLNKFKQYYLKQTTPILYSPDEGIHYWREKILLILFYFSVLTVGIVYVPSVIMSIKYEFWLITFIDFIGYPLVLYLFFSKQKSVEFRAYIIIIYLYVLSVIILIELGESGAGFYWLFVVAPMAAILINSKTAYTILLMNLILFGTIGFLGKFDSLQSGGVLHGDLSGWAVIMINFLFANSMVTIVIINILDGLNETLMKEQKVSKELEKQKSEIFQAKLKIENTSKMKSNFLSQISHEIRTPINTILNYLNLLKYETENISDNSQIYLQIVNKSSKRLIRTVDLMLNLSEVQTGTYEVLRKPIEIYPDIINKVIEEQKQFADEKKLNLKILMEEKLPIVFGDIYSITQIYSQIIENAIKFTDKGEITISFNENNGLLVVEISDTGIGIDRNYLEKLFQPFTQEEEGYTRKYDGSGIGLALVKNYCDLNNISIKIESEKGKGTKVLTIFNS